mmetsp:Transcript_50892/g.110156  ORF Transcript_50892/g.110156 Transcript_50892/m.110156 type:complete len:121 (+) Transcript_50892:1043-1405(+)
MEKSVIRLSKGGLDVFAPRTGVRFGLREAAEEGLEGRSSPPSCKSVLLRALGFGGFELGFGVGFEEISAAFVNWCSGSKSAHNTLASTSRPPREPARHTCEAKRMQSPGKPCLLRPEARW